MKVVASMLSVLRLCAVLGLILSGLVVAQENTYSFRTIAGFREHAGAEDGSGMFAKFSGPEGLAVDSNGNLYVADTANHTIRKITPQAQVTTYAGQAGVSGSADGAASVASFKSPRDVAIDSAGNIYVSDSGNHLIRRITPNGVVSTVAGVAGSAGSINGTGSAARFSDPRGISVHQSGDIYVADRGNHAVRKVTPAGVVTTAAGALGQSGNITGPAQTARFSRPLDVAVDASGNILVVDTGNASIRRITPQGVVSTVTVIGLLREPSAIAVDAQGNLFVSQASPSPFDPTEGVHTLTKISTTGLTVAIGGTSGDPGSLDSDQGWATFRNPLGLAIDAAGILYVADTGNHAIRSTQPPQVALDFQFWMGNDYTAGAELASPWLNMMITARERDGALTNVRVIDPKGQYSDFVNGSGGGWAGSNAGNTPSSVAESMSGTWKIVVNLGLASEMTYEFVAIIEPSLGTHFDFTEMPALSAARNPINLSWTGPVNDGPMSFSVWGGDPMSGNYYSIWKSLEAGTTSTSLRLPYSEHTYSLGINRSSVRPRVQIGPAIASTGQMLRLLVTERVDEGGRIFNIRTSGAPSFLAEPIPQVALAGAAVTLTAEVTGVPPFDFQWQKNGKPIAGATSATLVIPSAAASDGGNYRLAVANSLGAEVSAEVKLTVLSGYTYSTIAGSADQTGLVDGTGSDARFSTPRGVTLDASGNLYVADLLNGAVRRISPEGAVTTVATQVGQVADLVVDSSGTIYTVDSAASVIRRVTTGGQVSLVAGVLNAHGRVDGAAFAAKFDRPEGIAIDSAGNLYVADTGNHVIRKISPLGLVSTIAGTTNSAGSTDGSAQQAKFLSPVDICVDATGNLFVVDGNHTVRKISVGGSVVTVAGLAGTTGSADGVGTAATFNSPRGITIDADLNLYIADTGNSTVRMITPDGVVSTIGGAPGISGSTDGKSSNARFAAPSGIAVDVWGQLYLADQAKRVIRMAVPIAPKILWDAPAAIAVGTPISEKQLNARSHVPGLFTYAPTLGTLLELGQQTLTAYFTPSDPAHEAVEVSTKIDVVLPTRAGVYFGQFSDGGSWALRVKDNGTAVYIAHLPGSSRAFIAEMTVGADGVFATEVSAVGPASVGRTAAAERARRSSVRAITFELVGRISEFGTVTGELVGSDETFAGELDGAPGAAASFYEAPMINSAGGALYGIIGSTGRALVVVASSALAESVAGYLTADGSITGSTGSVAQIAATFDSVSQKVTATVGGAGLETARFAGLADTLASTTRLVAISTRSRAGEGDQTLIMGFVVAGSGQKELVVRGVGPTLKNLGVADALTDPELYLYSGSTVLDQNGNWGGSPQMMQTFARLGMSPPLPVDSKDSALVRDISAGAYTAHVTTGDEASGISLVEVYDGDEEPTSRFTALATRTVAGSGENTLIAGIVLQGNAPKTLLIRGVGPSLVSHGVSASTVLQDPQLALFSGSEVIARNDNWGGTAELKDAFGTVGLATFDSDASKDAALSITLQPGVYTVHVSGVNNTSGVALIEVYEMP